MKKQIFLFLLVIPSLTTFGQVEKINELYKLIKEKDSLLFTIGFNTCDIKQFENLVSEYSGQTEPLNPGQTEPVIPVKLSHSFRSN